MGAQDVHPEPERLRQFIDGRLSETESLQIERHLSDCVVCCGILQQLEANAPEGNASQANPSQADASQADWSPNPLPGENELPGGRVKADLSTGAVDHHTTAHLPPLFPAGEKPGDTVGRYQLLQQIGEGGMGVVFLAEQKEPVRRKTALKIIKPGMDSRQVIARFEVERQALALMDHPNIARVVDAGATQSGRPYFVMELARGSPITEYCNKHQLTLADRLQLFLPVCHAIQHAHQKGIIHRDIKPSNVLIIQQDGRPVPKIIDFGVAKALEHRLTEKTLHTQYGQVIGTLEYMSPEQAEMSGLDVDTRSDVYSLGVLLYELLTGETPIDRKQARQAALVEVLQRIREEEPPRPSTRLPQSPQSRVLGKKVEVRLRSELDWIVMKALEKEPNRRYETVSDLAHDIERFLHHEPVEARPPSTMYRLKKFARRRRGVLAVVLSLAVMLIVLAIGSLAAAVRINHERHLAQQHAEAEQQERQRATAALKVAEEARQEAKREAVEGQSRLVRLYLATGAFSAEQGDPWTALLWHSRAWEVDRYGSRREASHRQRLATILQRLPRLVGVCFHQARILDAVFDAAGKRVLTRTEENQAYLWSPYESRQLIPPMKHQAPVLHACFSPDEQTIATSSADHTVRLWSAETGNEALRPLSHPGPVYWSAFHPEGHALATACDDGVVRFWRLPEGSLLENNIKCAASVRFVGYNSTGQLVLTADDSHHARLYRAADGEPMSPPLAHGMQPGNPNDRLLLPPAFSPDDQSVLTAHHRSLHLWNILAEQKTTLPESMAINGAYFGPDSQHLLVVGRSTGSHVRRTRGGEHTTRLSHPREVQQGCFSPDGSLIATSSSRGLVHVWDRRRGKEIVAPFRHPAKVRKLQFSPNGKLLLAAGADGTARVWQVVFRQPAATPYDLTSGRTHRLRAQPVSSAKLTPPSGKRMRAFSPDAQQEIRFIVDKTEAELRQTDSAEKPRFLRHGDPIRTVDFSGDGKRVLVVGSGSIAQWRSRDGQRIGDPIPHQIPPRKMGQDHYGKRMVTLHANGQAFVWDVDSGRMVIPPLGKADGGNEALERILDAQEMRSELIEASIEICAISPNGRRLALRTSKPGGPVHLIDLDVAPGDAQFLVSTPAAPAISGILQWIEFSPDSQLFAVASSNRSARIFDAQTGQPAGPPMHHPGFVRRVTFDPTGQRVATSTSNGTIRVWDWRVGDLLTPGLPPWGRRLRRLWFSQEGRRVIGLDDQDRAIQWELASFHADKDLAPALVRLLTGRYIDETEATELLQEKVFRRNIKLYRGAWLSSRGIKAMEK